MAEDSFYKKSVQHLLKDVETVLGVYNASQVSSTLELAPIETFVEGFKTHWGKITPDKFTAVKSKCSLFLSSLCYTDSMCSFNRRAVLDFSNHIRVDLLCNIMSVFLKRENMTKSSLEDVRGLINYLSLLESRNLKFISSLSYRYIRLVICFYLIGDYSDCSVIANFILQQAFISSGVDNSVREHLRDIVESRKELNSVHSIYTDKSVFTKLKEGAKEAKMAYDSYLEKKEFEKSKLEKEEESKAEEKEEEISKEENCDEKVKDEPVENEVTEEKQDEPSSNEDETRDEELETSSNKWGINPNKEKQDEPSSTEDEPDNEELVTSSNKWGIKPNKDDSTEEPKEEKEKEDSVLKTSSNKWGIGKENSDEPSEEKPKEEKEEKKQVRISSNNWCISRNSNNDK